MPRNVTTALKSVRQVRGVPPFDSSARSVASSTPHSTKGGASEPSITAELRAEVEELRRRLSIVPKATLNAAIQISELEKALLSIRQARDSALGQIHACMERIHMAEARVEELTHEFEHLQNTADTAAAGFETAKMECQELRGLLELKERCHADAIQKLEAQLTESRQRPTESSNEQRLVAQLKAASEKIAAQEAYFEQIQQQKKQANAALVSQLIKAERDRGNAETEAETLRQESEQQRAELEELRGELERTKKNLLHVESIVAARASESKHAVEVERQRQQIAELSAQLDAARDEVRLAWAVNAGVRRSETQEPDEEPIEGREDAIPTPLEGEDARAALDDMRETLAVAVRAPDPTEFLTIFGKQLKNFGQRSLCAGSVAAYRIAGVCSDLLKWVSATPAKLTSVQRLLDEAFRVLHGATKCIEASVHADLAESSVYVVDDDLDNCECIAMSLDKHGLRTHYASKAKLAIDHLGNQTCELIVLDVDLGSSNGFDLQEEIRRIPSHRKTPILFLSALGSAEDRVAELAESNSFLAKPYNLSSLSLKVFTMILKARLG